MTIKQEQAVRVAASAIAEDAGWDEGTEDYELAVEVANVAVRALMEAGLLLVDNETGGG